MNRLPAIVQRHRTGKHLYVHTNGILLKISIVLALFAICFGFALLAPAQAYAAGSTFNFSETKVHQDTTLQITGSVTPISNDFTVGDVTFAMTKGTEYGQISVTLQGISSISRTYATRPNFRYNVTVTATGGVFSFKDNMHNSQRESNDVTRDSVNYSNATYYVADSAQSSWSMTPGVKKPCTLVIIKVKNNYTEVNPPTGMTLTYNGALQTGVLGSSPAYTLSGHTNTPVGSYTATATITGTYYRWSDGTSTPKSIPWAINKAPAVATADSLSKKYGDADPPLTATVTGLFGMDVVSTSPSRDPGEDVGSYTIHPNGGTNPNYTVVDRDGTLTITKRPITIKAKDATKGYGEADPRFEADISPAPVGSDTINYRLVRKEGEQPGTYEIVVEPGENPNYEVSVEPGKLTIMKAKATITAKDYTITFGDKIPTFEANVSSLEPGDSLDYSLVCDYKDALPGTYKISVKVGTGKSNSGYSIETKDGTLTIVPKEASVTAKDMSYIFGETIAQPSATVSGELSKYPIKYSLSLDYGAGLPGKYPIKVVLGDNPGYKINTKDATLTITQKTASIKANSYTITYGDALPDYSAEVEGVLSSTPVNYELVCEIPKVVPGNYPIKVVLKENPGYDVKTVDGMLTILPKPATITGENYTITYGDEIPVFEAVVSGAVEGETLNYKLKVDATAIVPGSYTIDIILGDNECYDITTYPGTLAVNPRRATIVAQEKTITYGDPIPEFTAELLGFVNEDAIDYTLTCDSRDQYPGEYPIIVNVDESQKYNIDIFNAKLIILPIEPELALYPNDNIVLYIDASDPSNIIYETEARTLTYNGDGSVVATVDTKKSGKLDESDYKDFRGAKDKPKDDATNNDTEDSTLDDGNTDGENPETDETTNGAEDENTTDDDTQDDGVTDTDDTGTEDVDGSGDEENGDFDVEGDLGTPEENENGVEDFSIGSQQANYLDMVNPDDGISYNGPGLDYQAQTGDFDDDIPTIDIFPDSSYHFEPDDSDDPSDDIVDSNKDQNNNAIDNNKGNSDKNNTTNTTTNKNKNTTSKNNTSNKNIHSNNKILDNPFGMNTYGEEDDEEDEDGGYNLFDGDDDENTNTDDKNISTVDPITDDDDKVDIDFGRNDSLYPDYQEPTTLIYNEPEDPLIQESLNNAIADLLFSAESSSLDIKSLDEGLLEVTIKATKGNYLAYEPDPIKVQVAVVRIDPEEEIPPEIPIITPIVQEIPIMQPLADPIIPDAPAPVQQLAKTGEQALIAFLITFVIVGAVTALVFSGRNRKIKG